MENNENTYSRSRILDRIVDRFEDREKEGLVNYGTTMDRDDLSIIDWLVHLQEEIMDAVLYLEKLKQEIHYTEEVEPDMVINRPHLEYRDGHPFNMDQAEYLHNLARDNEGYMENEREESGLDMAERYNSDNYFRDKTDWANKEEIQKKQQCGCLNMDIYEAHVTTCTCK